MIVLDEFELEMIAIGAIVTSERVKICSKATNERYFGGHEL